MSPVPLAGSRDFHRTSVAPAQVRLQGPGSDGVVGVGDGEPPQGSEVASIGFAQDAQVGVKPSSTRLFLAQRRICSPLWAERIVEDHVDWRTPSGRVARIDFSAAGVFAAPFLRRLTPRRVSPPIGW